MMLRLIFLIFLFSGIVISTFSQGCPDNLDFEKGDFTNWQCFTGSVSALGNTNVISLSLSQPTAKRHEIISSATAVDPYGGFPQLCPFGGKYSVKLGNDSVGNQAEGLSYTLTIPSNIDTFTFTYFYAVVFENPGHSSYEQPRFFVSAYDVLTGIPIHCASFDYVASGGIPGFETSLTSADVLYKDWTPAALQFAGLGGRQVRLEFKTADCTLGGHFGYAYVDVSTGCSNIIATAPFCVETNSLVLNGPYGFDKYVWFNDDYSKTLGNTQNITLNPPPITSGMLHVDVQPFPGYGCRDTFHVIIVEQHSPDTPTVQPANYYYCQNQLTTYLKATGDPGKLLVWYTMPIGGTGVSKVLPSTNIAGTTNYYVAQKILFGCESNRKMVTVKVTPAANTSFTINTVRQCLNGNNYLFISTTTAKQNSTYTWDFGDGNTIQNSAADSIVNYVYTKPGNFSIKLTVTNDTTCSVSAYANTTVVPKPDATFTYPSVICEKQTNVSIQNTAFVYNGLSTINKWWWNINGVISTQPNPPNFIPTSPGLLRIKYVATTIEGCRSDTNALVMNIHERPTANYKMSAQPLCDNVAIQFTDLSSFATTATDQINQWYWNFNGIINSSQNPYIKLPSSKNYLGRLVVTSNYGCISLPKDTNFIVYQKPSIGLSLNDSCVFKLIKFTALDLSNTVVKWYWNFGSGLHVGSSEVINIFYDKTPKPFTLIGETIEGCKDTIPRPTFAIYDNVAFAGKDTIAAKGEPVQLNAQGYTGEQYIWTPSTGLDNPNIETPIATLNVEQEYKLHSLTKEGCVKDSKIIIKRYAGPELYVPTGFTPNKDGLNDGLKVFPVGIKQFNYLAVYNRNGNVIFRTTDYHKGWDGTHNGKQVDAGGYVFITEAIDYKGNRLLRKGNVVVIR
jgi:gliding motility-associated-like protein